MSKSEHNTQQRLLAPQRVDPIRLRELLATWLVERRHPFIEVESQAFTNFVEYLNPLAVNKLPKSGNTCRADIMKCFQSTKSIVKESLRSARSRIHLSFDLWISPNYKAILAIVGHWTNSEYKVEIATLGMRVILGEHKGVDLTPVLLEVIKEYEIKDKLGWFMSDNAGNNDIALRNLNELLQEEGGQGFDIDERRLRRLGHIV